jgi:hypothetical protein
VVAGGRLLHQRGPHDGGGREAFGGIGHAVLCSIAAGGRHPTGPAS